MAPPEGGTGPTKPSRSWRGFRGVGDHATQRLPRAHATRKTLSSSTTAEAGVGVFAPELHPLQQPPRGCG